MIAKFLALVCLFGLARAGHLYGGSSLGYAVAPSYSAYAAPVAYAPAVSSVSQYSIHSAPVVKSYAPVAYTAYSSPVVSHGYAPALSYGYGAHSYGGYGGYGGYGKYSW